MDTSAKQAFDEGIAYSDKDDYESAAVAFTEAIRLDPTRAEAYADLGLAYSCMAEFDKAVCDCDEAIRLNSDLALRQIGWPTARSQDLPTARHPELP
jgi:tetratricopeptide (TPR) repeat protein